MTILASVCCLLAEIMTPWGESGEYRQAHREYPRPQLERAEWTSLNGEWDYEITGLDGVGATTSKQSGKILVPFCFESALSGVKRLIDATERMVYSRTFDLAEIPAGRRLHLNFEAVDYSTQVFVNGQEATDVPHEGGNLPFSVDITDFVRVGSNELVVKVWDPTKGQYGGSGKQYLKSGSIFYTRVSGIWQSVWMEWVPESHVADYRVVTDIDAGRADFTFELAAAGGAPSTLSFRLDGESPIDVTVAGAKATVSVEMPPGFECWSPEHPRLYWFTVRYGADEFRGYFAMRKIGRCRDERGFLRFALNGQPYYFLGTLDQGWWPDGLLTPPCEAAVTNDLLTLRRCGFNAIRKHLKVESRRYYYQCDRLGVAVLQDLPSTGLEDFDFSRRRYAASRQELREMIDTLRNIPSIMMWIPYNEAWGQPGAELTGETLRWTRRYDPTRLVDGPSGWDDYEGGVYLKNRSQRLDGGFASAPVGLAADGRPSCDVVDLHEYPGPGMPTAPDRIRFLGEFGGIGLLVADHVWPLGDNAAYGGYGGVTADLAAGEARYLAMCEQLAGLKARGLAGSIYTQTTDCETELNGLMTYDRKVLKFDAERLRAAHQALLESSEEADPTAYGDPDAAAATYVWRGGDGLWSHTDSWSGGGTYGIPDSAKYATASFPSSLDSPFAATLRSGVSVKMLDFQSPQGTLRLDNAKITVAGQLGGSDYALYRFATDDGANAALEFIGANAALVATQGGARIYLADREDGTSPGALSLRYVVPSGGWSQAPLRVTGYESPVCLGAGVRIVVDATAVGVPEVGATVTVPLIASTEEIRSYSGDVARILAAATVTCATGARGKVVLSGKSVVAKIEPRDLPYRTVANEGGPVLGYAPGTAILTAGGRSFKDLSRNGRLDPYEDWRLDATTRATNLASLVALEDIWGLMDFSPTIALQSTTLTSQQKTWLNTNRIRHILVGAVPSAVEAAKWNNVAQLEIEGRNFGIPLTTASDPRHAPAKTDVFTEGERGAISRWPEGIGFAATFDPETVREFANTLREEYRAFGFSTTLAPQADLATEPRWRRFLQTYGECPELAAEMMRAYGDGVQSCDGAGGGWGRGSLIGCAKHWPGGGCGEGGRDAHFGRGKFAVYPGGGFEQQKLPFLLGGFALRGGTGSCAAVMPYYTICWNQTLENVANAYNRDLIDVQLRSVAGFDGVVCTDWQAVSDYDARGPNHHSGKPWGVESATEPERCLQCWLAGCDQFGGVVNVSQLAAAYDLGVKRRGAAKMQAMVRASAARLLRNLFRVGLFENPYVDPDETAAVVGSPERMKAGYDVQVKSVVMLKNRGGALPLARTAKVWVPPHVIPGWTDFWGGDNAAVTEQPVSEAVLSRYFAVARTAAEADAAIVFVDSPRGGWGYSEADRQAGGNGYVPISLQYGDYVATAARGVSIAGGDRYESFVNRSYRGKTVTTANAAEADFVADVRRQMGTKPVIVVMNLANPAIPGTVEADADGFLAVAATQHQAALEIISGRVEPSGLLPFQMPRDMATVEAQFEDLPFDMEPYVDADGNAWDFAFGLNWSGRIADARTARAAEWRAAAAARAPIPPRAPESGEADAVATAYVWKGGDGRWMEPANWSASRADAYGIPSAALATATIPAATAKGATVAISGFHPLAGLAIQNEEAVTLAFAGGGLAVGAAVEFGATGPVALEFAGAGAGLRASQGDAWALVFGRAFDTELRFVPPAGGWLAAPVRVTAEDSSIYFGPRASLFVDASLMAAPAAGETVEVPLLQSVDGYRPMTDGVTDDSVIAAATVVAPPNASGRIVRDGNLVKLVLSGTGSEWAEVEAKRLTGVTAENRAAVEATLDALKVGLGTDADGVGAWLGAVYGEDATVPAEKVAAARNLGISVEYRLPLMANDPIVAVEAVEAGGGADAAFRFAIRDGAETVQPLGSADLRRLVRYTLRLRDGFGPALPEKVAIDPDRASFTARFVGHDPSGFIQVGFSE